MTNRHALGGRVTGQEGRAVRSLAPLQKEWFGDGLRAWSAKVRHMVGDRRGGRTAPTSKDVAALAGVAQSTVSAVLNDGRVTPDTRSRVEDAMRKLRYQPNAGARTLRTAKTRVIALIVQLGTHDDAAETVPYIEAIVDEARQRDHEVLLSTIHEGPTGLSRLAGRSVCDAFVMMDVQTHDDRVARAAELGLPVVLFGRPRDPHGLDAVDFDTRRSAELLVDELVGSGHRHIAALGEPARQDSFRFIGDFYEGARTRAAHHGVDFTVVPRREEGWQGVLAAGNELLAHRGDALGLIARTPRLTEWTVHLLELHGLTPGVDVSLVSSCSEETALSFARPITNVAPQPRRLSARAMRLLFDRLEGADGPAQLELIEPELLIRRGTTARF